MSAPNELKIAEARDALRKGDLTAVELTEACLTAIEGAAMLRAAIRRGVECSECVGVWTRAVRFKEMQ